jgi:isopenicillin N synthase-like dioxygenase
MPTPNGTQSPNNSDCLPDDFEFLSKSGQTYHDLAVDLSNYRINAPTDDGNNCDVQEALWTQLQDTGFCLIRGTGIPSNVCQSALDACHAFLQDATEDVRRSTLTKDRARRGYSPMGTENFASLIGERGAPNDVVRKFRVGPLDSTGESSLLQPNVWPRDEWEHAETFRHNISIYYQYACRVAATVVRAICDAVGSKNRFQNMSSLHAIAHEASSHTSILTLLGYRFGSRHSRKLPLVAPHTDVGVATMLLFDSGDCATLQRKSSDGTWTDVRLPRMVGDDPIFVVNIGDCLSDLSGGTLPSTLHQVMPHSGKNPRNCLALFMGLDPRQELIMPHTGDVLTYETWRKQRIARAQSVIKPR